MSEIIVCYCRSSNNEGLGWVRTDETCTERKKKSNCFNFPATIRKSFFLFSPLCVLILFVYDFFLFFCLYFLMFFWQQLI